MLEKKAFLGSAYYSLNESEVRYIHNGLICIDSNGVIEDVIEQNDENFEEAKQSYKNAGTLKELTEDQILIPGFVDLHIHAPQWPQSGTALDRPLEVWLNEYTFPLEAKYRDLDFAKPIYEDVVKTTLSHGTTTALYFATVDKEPSVLLAKICGELGQRGLVGKIGMDDPYGNPDYCRDKTPEESIEQTEEFICEVLEFKDKYIQKVYPVVTPRFIPSCTDEAMRGLGKLAAKYNVHVQTHCSESDWEHGFCLEKHGVNDAQSLDAFGLLTDKTVLAHATFLDEKDVALLAERKTSIAHCPLSNAYFANSVLPFKDFSNKGVNIGVATDISGGYTPSMYQAIRQTVISSRMLNEGVNPALDSDVRGRKDSAITLNRAFYAATVGGGKALDLKVGKLEKGYAFDAQVIDLSCNIPRFYAEKKNEDLLHKVLLLSESQNVEEVWVQGQQVK